MSDTEKGGFISKVIGPKRRWRAYKARVRQLPENYRTAVEAIERYLMHFGPMDGDSAASLFEDLADLFEQAAADGTPIREIVGEDPVEFVEALIQNYGGRLRRHPGAETADQRHRARRGREAPMTARTTSEPAIHVQGLEKSYKKLQVLRGVDFDVARGSIFALLGSNGAGKTTVVKILSTLLKADAGTASVNGFDVATQAADVRESISLTGQFAAVDEILSGRENLVLVARLRHVKDPGAIADDLLERFSLTDAAARRVSTYSGGMRRRLDIAMSLIGNSPVIFLDEPTTGLDPQARIEVWQAVKEPRRGRHDGAAHHPVPGRGRTTRRPDRDPAPGSDHRERHPGRAQAAAPAGQGRVRREAADPGGRLPRHRR